MRLKRYLEPSLILLDEAPDSKESLFKRVASKVQEAHPNIDPEGLLGALKERESVGTTFLGGGVALPHARILVENEVVLSLVRLRDPIAFGTNEDEQAWLVVFSAVDTQARNRHIQILARLCRVLHDPVNLDAIRGATTPGDVIDILSQDDPREVR